MSATNPRPMYYSKPTIDPTNDKRVWLPGTYIVKSEDGGATFEEEPTSPTYDVGLKTDHHVIRVDPANPAHIYVVGDGGLHESWDMGKTYMRGEQHPRRPDLSHRRGQSRSVLDLRRLPGQSLVGRARARRATGSASSNQDWVEIGFSDGTGKAVDIANWRKVYSSSSGGNLSLVDPVTGDVQALNPRPPAGEPPYRYAWDAPVMASQHTSAARCTSAANRLFISHDFGSTWTRTKDLTRSINRDTLTMMGVAEPRHQAVAQRRRRREPDLELRRVAGRREGALGRHRRRQRAAHDGRRAHLDRAEQEHPRRAGRRVRRQDRRVGGVARHRLRDVRRASRRRLRALHRAHHRLRQDVEDGHRRPAGATTPRCAASPSSRARRTCCSRAPSARCSSRWTAARTGTGSRRTSRRRATTTS